MQYPGSMLYPKKKLVLVQKLFRFLQKELSGRVATWQQEQDIVLEGWVQLCLPRLSHAACAHSTAAE